MPSGDGLLARVRPWCGAFSLDEARGLADLAERLGNGHIDFTRRANLQIRGVREERVVDLQAALAAFGLLDRDAQIEAGRNIMVGPLAGIDPVERLDVRPIVRTLVRLLASDAALHDLPSKFAFLVDGGGRVSIAGERADVSLRAAGSAIAVGIGAEWIGSTSPDNAARVAVEAARAFLGIAGNCNRVRELPAERFAELRSAMLAMLRPFDGGLPSVSTRPLGVLALGAEKVAVGIAAPFGRIEAQQLHRLVAILDKAGASDIRLSPWRTLYVEARDRATACMLVEAAGAIGLVVDDANPILRIDACPGAPACRSSSVDTRDLAVLLARRKFDRTIHISGCAKGCARSEPAELVLVGEHGRYGVVRNGTARSMPERIVDAGQARALLDV
jgi:precorrin-3B synthase